MKNLLIVGNWKSNMTKDEARNWLENFSTQTVPENAQIVLLAPFTLLDMIGGYIRVNDLPIKLGVQDISPFPKGAYTGEIYSGQIKELADYVLIGHSERRSNFSESNEMINRKIEQAKSVGLQIVVCISELDQVKSLPPDELTIAFEPISAIGTGNPENPEDVRLFVSKIKEIKNVNVLYGGSVNSEDVKSYISLENINGVLVGSKSLDAQSFSDLIKNAV